ncbi:hypothetical protein [Sulfitobacter mediterraneus]|uniref:Uncharacterized protein n=1 Tax=Sulfitobacter mediterraneus TaxID=83219 RepID=A0A2T6CBN2_9RHOB|nr:hypothetical protein [Sulfitobacter mediterraneus]PTX72912.1 hypothetical protein C8N31_110174 [Sulfitobacter mediterraneus]
MAIIPINEPELLSLEFFRVALSEDTHEARMRGIDVMRQEVVSMGLPNFPIGRRDAEQKRNRPEFVQWVAETSAARYDAAHECAGIIGRYERKNERKLNVAEEIGKLVWDSIQSQRFQGLHVTGGILEQVRDLAKALGISGARDKDTLRKIWSCYRGVVHLGMAMDYLEDNPETDLHLLHIAERFRKGLSQNCPKGKCKPYVAISEQISFLYISGA